ncbi:MAG: hypothetical protein RBR15_08810 [Sphaerochaeta sp.]|nr:hypothetical protein [Sphaerochaeta sp.]
MLERRYSTISLFDLKLRALEALQAQCQGIIPRNQMPPMFIFRGFIGSGIINKITAGGEE